MALSVLLRSACNTKVAPLSLSMQFARLGGRSFTAASHKISPAVILNQVKPKAGNLEVIRKFSVSPIRNSAQGSHSTLWSAERALALGLLGIIPVAIAFPSQIGDALMAVSIIMHSHWGLEAVVVDYIRPILFGHTIPKIAHGLLILLSATTLGGLFYFIYHDIGIANSIRKIWAIKPHNA